MQYLMLLFILLFRCRCFISFGHFRVGVCFIIFPLGRIVAPSLALASLDICATVKHKCEFCIFTRVFAMLAQVAVMIVVVCVGGLTSKLPSLGPLHGAPRGAHNGWTLRTIEPKIKS